MTPAPDNAPDAQGTLPALSRSPLVEMFSDGELAAIAQLCRWRRYTAGQTVFEEGDLGDSLYVIVSGEVEVLRRDEHGSAQEIAVLGAPESFGEMSLFDKEYRSATVRARSDAELLQLTSEQLTGFRNTHKDGFTFLAINIARVLSKRLRRTNSRLHP